VREIARRSSPGVFEVAGLSIPGMRRIVEPPEWRVG